MDIRITEFSETGSYNLQRGMKNQDAVLKKENARFIFIALADGVSECLRSTEGAYTACKAAQKLFMEKGQTFMQMKEEKAAYLILGQIVHEVTAKAQEDKVRVEEYASTAMFVLYDKKTRRMLIFNLGDGMVLICDNEGCRIHSAPEKGTDNCHFTVGSCAKDAKVCFINAESVGSVCICSDGAWTKLFGKSRLKEEIKTAAEAGDYEFIKEYLKSCDRKDDCSFIALNFERSKV